MFCGFNKKMLKGLKDFNEGLVEHGLIFKSKQNNESIEQAIRKEISDMTRLLSEIHRIEDSPKRLMTEGLVKYVMYFYVLMRQRDIENYKVVIEKINEFFYYMDDKYYSELEGNADDMKELAELLNEKEI